MTKQQVVTDAEKIYEHGAIDLLILNRQPHRCLLDLAKLYGLRGVGKMKREDLITKILEAHCSKSGDEARKAQFVSAISTSLETTTTGENIMGIIPDVQDPAEVQAVIDAQENWVPTNEPLPDRRIGMEDTRNQDTRNQDTIVVRTSKGEHEELSQSFVDALDAQKVTKSRKSTGFVAGMKSKISGTKFTSDGGIEQRVKQMGIKTPQVLVCARAADTFDEPFDLNELAAKADELGLVTKQGALFIVKYYLGKLVDAGLTAS